MAASPYTLTLKNSFNASSAEQATLHGKYDALHEPSFSLRKKPHVEVVMTLGTEKTMVTRTQLHGYQGHTPLAPCLLGRARTEQYTRAIMDTSPQGQLFADASWQAMVQGAKKGFVGGVVGSCVMGALVLTGVVAHFVSLPCLLAWYAFSAAFGALVDARAEHVSWSAARARFESLELLSATYDDLKSGRVDEADVSACFWLVDKQDNSSDWALRQACNEFAAEAKQLHLAAPNGVLSSFFLPPIEFEDEEDGFTSASV